MKRNLSVRALHEVRRDRLQRVGQNEEEQVRVVPKILACGDHQTQLPLVMIHIQNDLLRSARTRTTTKRLYFSNKTWSETVLPTTSLEDFRSREIQQHPVQWSPSFAFFNHLQDDTRLAEDLIEKVAESGPEQGADDVRGLLPECELRHDLLAPPGLHVTYELQRCQPHCRLGPGES